MALFKPELYYHPAVGVISPASLELYKLAPSMSVALSATEETQAFSQPQPESNTVSAMPKRPARTPQSLSRTAACAVTGEILPTSQMIRFVVTPDAQVVPDLTEKLPGTFMWIKATHAAIQKAIWRNTFASTARETVTIPTDLFEQLLAALSRQGLQMFNLARRAGEYRQGFMKVEELIKSGDAGLYIVASNASENGREKLERLAVAKNIPVIDLWTVEELSNALGEENAVHIALIHGGIAQNLLNLSQKLKDVRSDEAR